MKVRKLVTLILTFVMVCSLAACGGTNQGGDSSKAESKGADNSSAEGKTLVVASNNDVTSNFTNDSSVYNVFGNAVCYDEITFPNQHSGKRESALLDSWKNEDKKLTLEFKPGITFTDGTPLTGEDVIYSYKRFVDEGTATETLKSFDWENATYSEDDGHLTVVIPTFDDYAPGIAGLDDHRIVCKAFQEAHPADDEIWFTTVQGTGPYYCAEQISGVSSTYKLRDNYWGDETFEYDTIICKYYSDSTATMIDFEDGKIDIIQQLDDFGYEEIQSGKVDGGKAKMLMEGNVIAFSVDYDQVEAWNDVRVRQAVAMAIDVDAMGTAGFGGLYEKTDSMFPKSCLGYKADPYENNIDKAKELMKEAGYENGFTIKFCARDRYADAAEILQGQLAKIGITLEMEVADTMSMINKKQNSETECVMCWWVTDASGEPSNLYNTATTTGGTGFPTDDAHLSDLVKQANTETDDAKRLEILEEMQDYWHENCFQIVLMDQAKAWGYNAEKLGDGFELFRGGRPIGLRYTKEQY